MKMLRLLAIATPTALAYQGGPPRCTLPAAGRWRSGPVVLQDLATLKSTLLSAIEAAPERGLAQYEDWKPRPLYMEDVELAVGALVPLDPSYGDWMIDDNFEGSWRLAYTSSPSFKSNGGLSGYAFYVEGVETPELKLHLLPNNKLRFEEPLDASSAAALRRFLSLEGPPSAVLVECSWVAGPSDSFKLTYDQVIVGSKAWKPVNAAEQGEVDFGLDKAIRVLGATRPVYLDADLLILQALTDAFFVLVRVPSTT